MEHAAIWISVLSLAFGAGLGLKGWLDPAWAARIVRLQPGQGQPEGIAEFRGTFGGMFLGLHLAALILVHLRPPELGDAACWVIASGWWGTAAARLHAYLADPPARHPYVRFSIGLEVVVGLLVAALPLARLIG